MSDKSVRKRLPDWEAPRRPLMTAPELLWLAGLAATAATALFLLGEAFAPPGTGITLVLFMIAGVALSIFTSGRRALLQAHAVRVEEGSYPRFEHLSAGLARDMGVDPPKLRVIAEGGPNALVCRSGGEVIAVTASLLEQYSRTELEAVLAHCLVRLHGGGLWKAQLASELLFLAGPLRPIVGFDDDLRAVAITRFPPALIDAIRKAKEVPGRHAPLWFAGEARWHRPAEERIALLEDL